MIRRDFLRKTSIATGIAAIPAVTLASAAELKKTSEPVREDLSEKVRALEDQVKKLSSKQKKMLRTVAIVVGISVGLDVTLLI